MKRLLVIVPLVVFVGVAFLLAARLWRPQTSDQDPMLGRKAPVLVLETLPGQAPVPQRIEGPALVNFWASWCTPCRAEHPLLVDLQEAGLVIYGVAYKNAAEDVRLWLNRYGNPYKAVGLDPEGRTALAYGIVGVPETFFIGEDGRIKDRIKGPLTPERLQTLIQNYRKSERENQSQDVR